MICVILSACGEVVFQRSWWKKKKKQLYMSERWFNCSGKLFLLKISWKCKIINTLKLKQASTSILTNAGFHNTNQNQPSYFPSPISYYFKFELWNHPCCWLSFASYANCVSFLSVRMGWKTPVFSPANQKQTRTAHVIHLPNELIFHH